MQRNGINYNLTSIHSIKSQIYLIKLS